MKAGGLDGVFLAVFVSQHPELTPAGFKAAYDEAMAKFDAIDRLTKMHPELCELARTPADVERIAKTGKRVILIGVENGYPAGDDLANVKEFYDRGARYMTLVHASHNQLADSSGAEGAAAQRPVGAGQEGRGRDEPPRDDGGPLARVRQVVLGRDRHLEGADHRVALRLRGGRRRATATSTTTS